MRDFRKPVRGPSVAGSYDRALTGKSRVEGYLMMSAKERKRLLVFDRLGEGQLSLGSAARWLQISYRQCARSYKRYRAEGAKGLVHLSRGRPSNRAKREEIMHRDTAIHDCLDEWLIFFTPPPHGVRCVFPLPY